MQQTSLLMEVMPSIAPENYNHHSLLLDNHLPPLQALE
jgi:hypothetical protein